MADRTFALIYHDVADEPNRDALGFPGPVAGVYKLTPERFKAHLEALAAAGQWFGAANLGSRALLTFDDGGASSLWIAGELERYGWRGAFFIVTSRIGTAGFLDASGVRELAERGHLVGSHSHTHPAYMARLNGSALAQEWSLSRSALSDLLGSPPRTGAVPGGSVSSTVIEQAARAGYEALFTSTPRARINRRYGMPVLGRYTVWADDPPELAVALVKGELMPRARRWLGWQAKSAAKRLSPRVYEAARAIHAPR